MIRKNDALARLLCAPYCGYYKPDKNEELLCGGAVVIERLVQSGRIASPLQAAPVPPGNDAREQVAILVCNTCAFREQDCDFAEDRSKQPCGGFLLLAELIQNTFIKMALGLRKYSPNNLRIEPQIC